MSRKWYKKCSNCGGYYIYEISHYPDFSAIGHLSCPYCSEIQKIKLDKEPKSEPKKLTILGFTVILNNNVPKNEIWFCSKTAEKIIFSTLDPEEDNILVVHKTDSCDRSFVKSHKFFIHIIENDKLRDEIRDIINQARTNMWLNNPINKKTAKEIVDTHNHYLDLYTDRIMTVIHEHKETKEV